MSRKIRNMEREIERRGGLIWHGQALPDEVYERFLEEILGCPDCQAEAPESREQDPAPERGH